MGYYKHGLTTFGRLPKVYAVWLAMRQRCLNPNNSYYRLYGGRGITICSRWDEFLNFSEDMGERPLGMTLERIDNNGNYCPENCRWDTQKAQVRNQRRVKLTQEKADKIRRLFWQWGLSRSAIAKHFEVSHRQVCKILRREKWVAE